ncbi:AraC family transcriptional regulator [Burkholderia stagnalis]
MKEFLLKQYPNARTPLARQVLARVDTHHHGERVTWHQHHYGQLVFADPGVVRVLTPTKTWTQPSSRAVWIPSNVDHELHAIGDSSLWSVYIEPEAFPWPWTEPTAISISALLRELAATIRNAGNDYAADSVGAVAATLLLKLLAEMPSLPESGIRLPRDEQLLKICEHLMNDPADDQTLEFWGERFATSGRTLARRFKSETGITFGAWRLQLRVAEAITRLALGQSVAKISKDLKYSSPGAFITMFRQITGDAPRRYIAAK